eukprot:scaffold201478_cov31-Tisochrysis_lutea.AAC.1
MQRRPRVAAVAAPYHIHPSIHLPGPPPPTDLRTLMPHTWSEGACRGGQAARPPPAVSRQRKKKFRTTFIPII